MEGGRGGAGEEGGGEERKREGGGEEGRRGRGRGEEERRWVTCCDHAIHHTTCHSCNISLLVLFPCSLLQKWE